VGICPYNALEMSDNLDKCIPVLKGICNKCGLCYDACPGKYVSFPDLNRDIFGKKTESFLGNHKELFVGHATDKTIWEKGASGGVVSAILINLIESGEVDGAIVLGTSAERPWQTEVQIVRDKDSILAASQSKYVISPVNTILRELKEKNGKFAFVGLPCHVQALRKLEKIKPDLTNKIKYIVGLYCGNNMYFNATKSLLRRFGVNDLREIKSLEYRAGEWPGKFEVILKNGKKYSIKKFFYNYLIQFYIAKRCLLCIDLSNEFADISVGDGWLPEFKEKGLGWSVVVVRTNKGKNVLDNAVKNKALFLKEISEKQALNMHSHGLDFKKKGAFIRLKLRKMKGKAVPDYEVNSPKISTKRVIIEIFVTLIFYICSFGISKKIIQKVPLGMLGIFFTFLRKTWRTLTKFK